MTDLVRIERSELPRLPRRLRSAHKGDFGRILLAAGSYAMPGAAALAAASALRGGAGLAAVLTPRSAVPSIAAHAPCATYVPAAETEAGGLAEGAIEAARRRFEWADVVAVGPGLGLEEETVRFVRALVTETPRPLVVDADGLNALAGVREPLRAREAPTVLTPHPGEFARMVGGGVPRTAAERLRAAAEAARSLNAVVCLKGRETVVTDGRRVFVNDTGNPGMATGGTGDVLTGLLAALIAQLTPAGVPVLEAAALAVHVHGKAGDLAAADKGEVSLVATDVVEHLPAALSGHVDHG